MFRIEADLNFAFQVDAAPHDDHAKRINDQQNYDETGKVTGSAAGEPEGTFGRNPKGKKDRWGDLAAKEFGSSPYIANRNMKGVAIGNKVPWGRNRFRNNSSPEIALA